MNKHSQKLTIFVSFPSPILSNWIPSGDGLLAFEYISRIAEMGHQLHVICQYYDIKNFSSDNITFYPLNPNHDRDKFINGIPYMIKSRQLFLKLDKQYNFDLIHELNPGFTGVSLAFFGLKIPLIIGPSPGMWPHDCDVNYSDKIRLDFSLLITSLTIFKLFILSLIKDLFKFLQNLHASKLLLMSQSSHSGVGRLGYFKNKYQIITVGIDTSKVFKNSMILNNMEVNNLDSVILFLAGMVTRKGIFTLIEAYEKVVEKIPNCKLVIAGNGPQLSTVKTQVQEMKCSEQISIVGSVDRSQVFHYMSNCSLYCLPSYGEPFGITLLEAMACGKPIVTTNIGGPNDIIHDEGGRRVKPRDSGALAQAIIEILSSKDLQITMGEYNFNLIRDVYTWDKIIPQLENVYFEVLEAKPLINPRSKI